jgi:hypothetical protein
MRLVKTAQKHRKFLKIHVNHSAIAEQRSKTSVLAQKCFFHFSINFWVDPLLNQTVGLPKISGNKCMLNKIHLNYGYYSVLDWIVYARLALGCAIMRVRMTYGIILFNLNKVNYSNPIGYNANILSRFPFRGKQWPGVTCSCFAHE